MKSTAMFISIAAAIGTYQFAEAGPSFVSWSTAPAGCNITLESTAHIGYRSASDGSVYFNGNEEGDFHLMCPIRQNAALTLNPYAVVVAYHDEDSGSGCEISGTLRYHSRTSTGNGSIASFAGSGSGTSARVVEAPLSSAIDLDNNVYWVDFYLSRPDVTTGGICSVDSVFLTNYNP